jgi:hypothetical protein
MIDLPLHTRHSATARAVAASLGADAGFNVDDIDDLRLGVNEAVAVLTDTDVDPGPDARLQLQFDVEPGRIVVAVRRIGVGEQPGELDRLATRILTAVVDEFGVAPDGTFRVVKSAP